MTRPSAKDYDYVQIHTSHDPHATGLRLPIRPDGFFRLVKPTPKGIVNNYFFLELDLTTDAKHFKRKVLAYLAYNQGGAEKRFGALRYRVLVVTDSYERLQKLKGITEETGGRSMFLVGLVRRIFLLNRF